MNNKLAEKYRAVFDAYDEALTAPSHEAALTELATRNEAKTARLRWNMDRNEDDNTEWVGAQHPSHVALRIVRRALDQYQLHGDLTLQGAEVVRYDGSGAHGTSRGRVVVQGRIVLANQHAVNFDMPVEIKEGRAQEPVVLRVDGIPHIIAQQTFDGFHEGATFTKTRDARRDLFSPPPDDAERNRGQEPIVHPGMFKLLASDGQQRTRMAMYQAINVGLQTRDDGPESSDLDPAERPLSDITAGCEVKAVDDIVIKGVGILLAEIPKGTRGVVLADYTGTGSEFVVEFPFRTVHVLAQDIAKVS